MKGPSSKREGPHVRPGFKAIKPLIYLKKHRNWARLHRGFPASFRPFSGAPMSNKETRRVYRAEIHRCTGSGAARGDQCAGAARFVAERDRDSRRVLAVQAIGQR